LSATNGRKVGEIEMAKKETYIFPIFIDLEDSDPDAEIKVIADVICDAIQAAVIDGKIKAPDFDITFGIYKHQNPERTLNIEIENQIVRIKDCQ
jgi:hypothetical protein